MEENRRECNSNSGVITAMEDSRAETSKRRKIAISDILTQCRRRRRVLENSSAVFTSPESSDGSDGVTVRSCSDGLSKSRSSCDDSHEPVSLRRLRSTDLEEARDFETEICTFTADNFSKDKEECPTSELCGGDTEELDSTAKPASRRVSPAGDMPAAAEIEEFFADAEKHEAKRFAERYNYDIAKDVPLKGRYQWVLLKP